MKFDIIKAISEMTPEQKCEMVSKGFGGILGASIPREEYETAQHQILMEERKKKIDKINGKRNNES